MTNTDMGQEMTFADSKGNQGFIDHIYATIDEATKPNREPVDHYNE